MIPEPALVLWILCAPLVLALIDLMRTPRVSVRHTVGDRRDSPAHHAATPVSRSAPDPVPVRER